MNNNLIQQTQPEQMTPNSEIDVVCRIRSKFDLLPKSHKRIAKYLLDNPCALANCSITQLSHKIRISPSTITRFCQALNFSGYPEFKFCLEKGVVNPVFQEEQIKPNEPFSSIKKKLHMKCLQAIDETILLLNDRDLKYATDSIMNADSIAFFAHGGSGVAAQFAQVLFMQIGIPCYCFNDQSMAFMSSAHLTRKDVAVGISYSGKASITIEALKTAKQNGATTIGITGFANSLLIRYSDIRLCYNATIEDDLRYLHIARICEIAILGTLQNCILSRNYDKLQKGMQISKDAFSRGRYN
jgi:DNA-binding MurR/RpiR family transcriptional regulator